MDTEATLNNLHIETRLQNVRPIWQRHSGWQLYFSRDGFYIIRYTENGGTLFLGVSSRTGEIKDLTFRQRVDLADHNIVLSTFGSAGLPDMRARADHWYNARPR
jgi:hypothetical protein